MPYRRDCWKQYDGRCHALTLQGRQCSFSQNCAVHRCGDPNCHENNGNRHTAHNIPRANRTHPRRSTSPGSQHSSNRSRTANPNAPNDGHTTNPPSEPGSSTTRSRPHTPAPRASAGGGSTNRPTEDIRNTSSSAELTTSGPVVQSPPLSPRNQEVGYGSHPEENRRPQSARQRPRTELTPPHNGRPEFPERPHDHISAQQGPQGRVDPIIESTVGHGREHSHFSSSQIPYPQITSMSRGEVGTARLDGAANKRRQSRSSQPPEGLSRPSSANNGLARQSTSGSRRSLPPLPEVADDNPQPSFDSRRGESRFQANNSIIPRSQRSASSIQPAMHSSGPDRLNSGIPSLAGLPELPPFTPISDIPNMSSLHAETSGSRRAGLSPVNSPSSPVSPGRYGVNPHIETFTTQLPQQFQQPATRLWNVPRTPFGANHFSPLLTNRHTAGRQGSENPFSPGSQNVPRTFSYAGPFASQLERQLQPPAIPPSNVSGLPFRAASLPTTFTQRRAFSLNHEERVMVLKAYNHSHVWAIAFGYLMNICHERAAGYDDERFRGLLSAATARLWLWVTGRPLPDDALQRLLDIVREERA